ncbi:MAG: TadE family protein [Robiginitomaculum sp.]
MSRLEKFIRNEDGVASVEFALLSVALISVTIGALELGLGFFQYNTAQQAARIGARLAAVSDPVARDMTYMTGLSNNVKSGDSMPDYLRTCSGVTQSCNIGAYNSAQMNALLYGPDNDGVCATTEKLRRGICDVFPKVSRENITISYQGSGLGIAGNPAVLSPLITVRLSGLEFDFAVADAFISKKFQAMPDIEVTMMAEDLR